MYAVVSAERYNLKKQCGSIRLTSKKDLQFWKSCKDIRDIRRNIKIAKESLG
jgi:hypothetical protein